MQLRKRHSFKLFLPTRAIAAAWYSITGWNAHPVKPVAQNVIDKITSHDSAQLNNSFRNISFTFAVIALSARIATARNALTRTKYVAFRGAFPLESGICRKLRKLFVMACENQAPIEHYVLQIKYIFPRQMDLFASLIDRLFSIATADGSISKEEERLLSRIAHLLDISATEYTDIRDRYTSPAKPHEVLGVEKRIGTKKLKKHYHALMREYHPDRYANENLSPEVDMLLRLKVSEINEAYSLLRKKAA